MEINEAISTIDKALSMVSATRETHILLQQSLKLLSEEVQKVDSLNKKVKELESFKKDE